MNERFTMTYGFIIDQTEVDAEGNFHFKKPYLPKKATLYRIHIAKKEYPAASLIHGGKDENFHLLLARAKDFLFLDGSMGFSKANILGSESNALLQQMKQWVYYADSSTFAGTPIKRELIVNAIGEKSWQLADTNTHSLEALIALYYADFESYQQLNSQYYQDFLERWKEEDSEYFKVFRSQINTKPKGKSSDLIFIILIFLALLIGFILGRFWTKSKAEDKSTDLLNVQEMKIYTLLKEGKTNKEISEEYHIGVNTVKSHVSIILSKLKLKSRREAMVKD